MLYLKQLYNQTRPLVNKNPPGLPEDNFLFVFAFFLHIFGNGDFKHRQHVCKHRFDADAQGETRLCEILIAAVDSARVVELVEQSRKRNCIACDFCGVIVLSGCVTPRQTVLRRGCVTSATGAVILYM